MSTRPGYPSRIICLTEETTEILYAIGAGELVVGVSGFTVRPPEARRKPRVSTYLEANIEKILALQPDVVFAWSDLQADIARDLIRRGVAVFTFNQRSIDEILMTVRMVGSIVGYRREAERLASGLAANLERKRRKAARLGRRPRVYFEEWPDPLISGIRWVSELIEIAGGEDIFPELRSEQAAPGRIVTREEIVRRDPELILASWCGKKVDRAAIAAREGFAEVAAVRAERIHEIKSALILQPGPAALTAGMEEIAGRIAETVDADETGARRMGSAVKRASLSKPRAVSPKRRPSWGPRGGDASPRRQPGRRGG
jgi:iron complex transport system substrate-binding protein